MSQQLQDESPLSPSSVTVTPGAHVATVGRRRRHSSGPPTVRRSPLRNARRRWRSSSSGVSEIGLCLAGDAIRSSRAHLPASARETGAPQQLSAENLTMGQQTAEKQQLRAQLQRQPSTAPTARRQNSGVVIGSPRLALTGAGETSGAARNPRKQRVQSLAGAFNIRSISAGIQASTAKGLPSDLSKEQQQQPNKQQQLQQRQQRKPLVQPPPRHQAAQARPPMKASRASLVRRSVERGGGQGGREQAECPKTEGNAPVSREALPSRPRLLGLDVPLSGGWTAAAESPHSRID